MIRTCKIIPGIVVGPIVTGGRVVVDGLVITGGQVGAGGHVVVVGQVITGGQVGAGEHVVVVGQVITGGQVGTGGQDGLVVADVDNPKYPKLACRWFFTRDNNYNNSKKLSNFY